MTDADSSSPTPSRTPRRLPMAVFVGATLVLLTATHWPQPSLPPMPGGDKTIHVLAYLVWGLTACGAVPRGTSRGASALVVGVGGAVLGAVDEVTQGIPGINRSPDFLDWVADCAGVATAIGVWAGVRFLARGKGAHA